MKRFILGFLIGVAALVLFVYYGGAGYMVDLGSRTERAGKKLQTYERQLKKTVSETQQSIKQTKKEAVKAVEKTKEKVKGLVD